MKSVLKNLMRRLGFQVIRARHAMVDPFELQKRLIKSSNPVIFDIGAHIGDTVAIYRKRFPRGVIHCFEPFPASYDILSTKLGDDPNSVCYNVAVADHEGRAILNSNTSSSTNSLLKTDIQGAFYWGKGLLETQRQVEVPTVSIDAFCAEKGILKIDILKMDVQGTEFSILEGARGMLAKQSISIIYLELILCPTYEGQRKLHEYLSFLDGFGYELQDFFHSTRKDDQLIHSDGMFLASSFRSGAARRGGLG